MTSGQNDEDSQALREHGANLVRCVDAAIRPWLRTVVEARVDGPVSPEHVAAIEAAIELVAGNAKASLTALAEADVDAPLSGPLERIRQETGPLAAALDAAGVPRPRRDPVDVEMRPDDVYAIGPYTFLDIGQQVHDAGITWGAAKAYVHAQRRRN